MNEKDIENLILPHKKRLQKLKEQQAIYGLDTPPQISIEIEEIEATIEDLQTRLNKFKSYCTWNIQNLLNTGFEVDELRHFYFDRFSPVNKLDSNISKAEVIDRIIKSAADKSEFEFVLTWAKERNPIKYKEHHPYIYPVIVADITMTNPSSESAEFKIPKGQLIEISDPDLNYQNMVVGTEIPVTIPPNKTETIRVPGMCVNPTKKWPNETSGNITPFHHNKKFSTQEDVWKAFGSGIPRR